MWSFPHTSHGSVYSNVDISLSIEVKPLEAPDSSRRSCDLSDITFRCSARRPSAPLAQVSLPFWGPAGSLPAHASALPSASSWDAVSQMATWSLASPPTSLFSAVSSSRSPSLTVLTDGTPSTSVLEIVVRGRGLTSRDCKLQGARVLGFIYRWIPRANVAQSGLSANTREVSGPPLPHTPFPSSPSGRFPQPRLFPP